MRNLYRHLFVLLGIGTFAGAALADGSGTFSYNVSNTAPYDVVWTNDNPQRIDGDITNSVGDFTVTLQYWSGNKWNDLIDCPPGEIKGYYVNATTKLRVKRKGTLPAGEWSGSGSVDVNILSP